MWITRWIHKNYPHFLWISVWISWITPLFPHRHFFHFFAYFVDIYPQILEIPTKYRDVHNFSNFCVDNVNNSLCSSRFFHTVIVWKLFTIPNFLVLTSKTALFFVHFVKFNQIKQKITISYWLPIFILLSITQKNRWAKIPSVSL